MFMEAFRGAKNISFVFNRTWVSFFDFSTKGAFHLNHGLIISPWNGVMEI